MYTTNVRDEPARPGPTRLWRYLTAYVSNGFTDLALKLLDNIDTGLRNTVLHFDSTIFVESEVITFFGKTDFYQFYLLFCI